MPLQKIKLADGSTVTVDVVSDTDRKFPLTPWDDPEKHPPTFGVNSSYVPQEYPKAVYTSFNKHIAVNDKEEEDAAIAAGGSLLYTDFPEPVDVTVDPQVALMQRIAILEAALLKGKKAS